jgi:hypothetical protein
VSDELPSQPNATIEAALKLSSPFGLPAHKEAILRVYLCAVEYIKLQRLLGQNPTDLELEVVDRRIRKYLVGQGWGKSRISLQVSDAKMSYRFFDALEKSHSKGARISDPKTFALLVEEFGIKNTASLRERCAQFNQRAGGNH